MDTEIRWTKKINNLFAYTLIILAFAGVGFTLLIHRVDLTMTSLIIAVPFIIAAVILILNKNISIDKMAVPVIERISFTHLFLTSSLIFIISIIIMVSYPTRTLTYFILMSVFASIILLQILSRRDRWTDGLIITEIVFLSLNLLWGVSLKYPLYFGDTDSLGHLSMIDTILKTAHIESFMTTYQNYPLFHILSAIGIEITGTSVRTGLFVLMGLVWQIGILFVYLISMDLSNSSKFAAISALCFASSSQIIFYGSYAIARSLALIFLLGWLYLIFNKAQRDFRYLLISLILMGAMIMTHHLNVIYVIPALVLIYICQLFINRSGKERLIDPLFIALLSICSISYLAWVASPMASSILPGMLQPLFSINIGSIQGDFTNGYGLSVILGAVYYSFVLLLCLLGIKIAWKKGALNMPFKATVLALSGLIMLLFYVPGPLELLPLSSILMTLRLQLIVSPFIAFLMAFGIIYLLNLKWLTSRKFYGIVYSSVLPAIFVAIMTFFSIISTGNAQDYNNFPHTATIDTPYFTEPELQAYSFISAEGNHELPLYSDYETTRNVFMLSDFSTRNIIKGGDISYIPYGYLVLRSAELERKTALTFNHTGSSSSSYRYHLDTAHPELNILTNLESKDRIYSDNDVEIYNFQ